LKNQRKANEVLVREVSQLCYEIEVLDEAHRQAAKSLSEQAAFLQEEQEKRMVAQGQLDDLVVQDRMLVIATTTGRGRNSIKHQYE
jgi:hypothetical protein